MSIKFDREGKLAEVSYQFNTINNVNDPAFLNLDAGECIKLLNVNIIDDGGIQRRDGYLKIASGEMHSGWNSPTKNKAYYVKDSIIYKFDGTTHFVCGVSSNNERHTFCEVNDVIFVTNGKDCKVIEEDILVDPVVPNSNHKIAVPAGQCAAFYNGRIYIGSENVLYCTEPYTAEYCDERFYIVADFADKIVFVNWVDDGLWVGTEKELFFLAGQDQQEGGFTLISKANYGCIYGTDVQIKSEIVKDMPQGTGILVASVRGVCFCGSGGLFKNITQTYYTYQSDTVGTAYIKYLNGNIYYVANLSLGRPPFNQFTPHAIDVDSI